LASTAFSVARHTDGTPELDHPIDWRATRELDLLMASQSPDVI
jgi:hypothetical protein